MHSKIIESLYNDDENSSALNIVLKLLGLEENDNNNNKDNDDNDDDEKNDANLALSFKQLGGDSLSAVKCSQMLETKYGLEVRVADLLSSAPLSHVLARAKAALSHAGMLLLCYGRL
jgi:acyl carrier protein